MPIVAHVRDLIRGCAAADVHVRLEAWLESRWQPLLARRSDETGRCAFDGAVTAGRGIYRLVYETDPYFVGIGLTPAYPEVVVVFRVIDDWYHSHVTVLVSSAGYLAFLGRCPAA